MTYEVEKRRNFDERVRKMVEAGYDTVVREAIVCTRCPSP